ncbi:MAG: Rrf2 family transcriptional regulator [Oscillospiraceae bacterium]
MKISTKGRYGLRLMVDLAANATTAPISLKEVAHRQDISDKYLEQIVTQLNRAGLVKSVRGAQGGYTLSRPSDEITVGDVLRVVEGSLSLVDCVDDNSCCDKSSSCATSYVWKKIKFAVEGVVDNISLKDLVDRSNEQAEFTYII